MTRIASRTGPIPATVDPTVTKIAALTQDQQTEKDNMIIYHDDHDDHVHDDDDYTKHPNQTQTPTHAKPQGGGTPRRPKPPTRPDSRENHATPHRGVGGNIMSPNPEPHHTTGGGMGGESHEGVFA